MIFLGSMCRWLCVFGGWAAILSAPAAESSDLEVDSGEVLQNLQAQLEVLSRHEVTWERVLSRPPNPLVLRKLGEEADAIRLRLETEKVPDLAHHLKVELRNVERWATKFRDGAAETSRWKLRFESWDRYFGLKTVVRAGREGAPHRFESGGVFHRIGLGADDGDVLLNTLSACPPMTVLHLLKNESRGAGLDRLDAWGLRTAVTAQSGAANPDRLILTATMKGARQRWLEAEFMLAGMINTRVSRYSENEEVERYEVTTKESPMAFGFLPKEVTHYQMTAAGLGVWARWTLLSVQPLIEKSGSVELSKPYRGHFVLGQYDRANELQERTTRELITIRKLPGQQ